MPGTNETEQLKLLGAVENLVRLRALISKEYEPWCQVITLLKERKIDDAALLASKSFGLNFMNDPIKQVIVDGISNLATVNGIDGHGVECLWSTTLGFGYLDMAYNAANQIIWKRGEVTPYEYQLASRYFKLAIDNSSSDSIKYSAMTNYAEIVREGLATGQKDWLGAIALYEEAGRHGLINAMFNAANVLLWLVEDGDRSYALRAQYWFETLIDHVESGKPFLDLGGQDEVKARLKNAKIRLAFMHIDGLSESPDLDASNKLLRAYSNDECVKSLFKQRRSKFLIDKCRAAPGSVNKPWEFVLSAMGWKYSSEPFDFELPSGIKATGSLLHVDLQDGSKMSVLSFDYFTHKDFDQSESYRFIAEKISNKYNKPVFIVGKKGFFIRYNKSMFDVVHVVVNGRLEYAPIWPGASSDQVLSSLNVAWDKRFIAGCEDPANTIPRIVNALDEGISLEGGCLPNAIWVEAGELLGMPIHRPDEPARIGLYVSQSPEELGIALQANAIKN